MATGRTELLLSKRTPLETVVRRNRYRNCPAEGRGAGARLVQGNAAAAQRNVDRAGLDVVRRVAGQHARSSGYRAAGDLEGSMPILRNRADIQRAASDVYGQ